MYEYKGAAAKPLFFGIYFRYGATNSPPTPSRECGQSSTRLTHCLRSRTPICLVLAEDSTVAKSEPFPFPPLNEKFPSLISPPQPLALPKPNQPT
jgi:hypothetical protein